MATRNLKRSELYKAVWDRPVQQVAAEIGVSDVAVAKACRKLDIPTPWRGYWRQKEFGLAPPPPPLPAWPDGDDPPIHFNANDAAAETPRQTPAGEFEARPENRVVVPDELVKPDRAVRRTLAALRRRQAEHRGLRHAHGPDCFAARVSPDSFDRAARILQALVVACQARDYDLVEGERPDQPLRVRVNGELLQLELSERTKQVLHDPTEREQIRAELNPGWEPPRYDWAATGVLSIRVANTPFPAQKSAWRDRRGERLEERLNDVLAGMAEAAVGLKEQREEAERRERAWKEKFEREETVRREAELKRARYRKLADLSRRWQEWQAVQQFLDAVRERTKVARPELVPTAEAWLDWGAAYLDEHRPTDVVFFDRLTEREDSDFWHYAHDR